MLFAAADSTVNWYIGYRKLMMNLKDLEEAHRRKMPPRCSKCVERARSGKKEYEVALSCELKEAAGGVKEKSKVTFGTSNDVVTLLPAERSSSRMTR
jgi:hypothetical protein